MNNPDDDINIRSAQSLEQLEEMSAEVFRHLVDYVNDGVGRHQVAGFVFALAERDDMGRIVRVESFAAGAQGLQFYLIEGLEGRLEAAYGSE